MLSEDDKPLIVWEKWRDPFGEKDQDQDIENDFLDDDGNIADIMESDITSKVLLTPMGIIPYNDNTASTKIFNFWLGHTNFSITKTIFNIIDSTDGIETLDLFTRYRFRVAIGKAFDDRQVMRNINTKIYSLMDRTKNGKS